MHYFESESTICYISRYKTPERVFHCSPTNKTVQSQGKTILASVAVPLSLYHQVHHVRTGGSDLKSGGGVRGGGAGLDHLTFTAFANGSLFPPPEGQEPINTFVIGAVMVGLEHLELNDPVVVVIRGLDHDSHHVRLTSHESLEKLM